MFSQYFASTVCFTHFSGRVLHRRCVSHFFQACFAPAGCFEPACFLRIFPGVFCTDGVFCIFSRRVLHRRGVLNQHAFYAFFRACFAPTVCFAFFPGVFCTGGVFRTSMLFTHFSGRVLHRRCVLHFFRASFPQAGCFADLPECFSLSAPFTAFAGVFHTAGVFRSTVCSARGRVTLRRRAHPAGVLRIPGAFGADGNGVFLFFGVLNACDLWSVSRRRCVFYLSPRG
jgi:hypothetical protein